jgi:hypothetical protein
MRHLSGEFGCHLEHARRRQIHFLIHPRREISATRATQHQFVCGLYAQVITRQQYTMQYPLPWSILVDRHGEVCFVFKTKRRPYPFMNAFIYMRELYVACLGSPAVAHPRHEFNRIVQDVFLAMEVHYMGWTAFRARRFHFQHTVD